MLAKTQEILDSLADDERQDLFLEMTARAFRGINEERAITDRDGQLLGFFLPPALRGEYIMLLARETPDRVPDLDARDSFMTASELIAHLEAKYPSTDDPVGLPLAANSLPAIAR